MWEYRQTKRTFNIVFSVYKLCMPVHSLIFAMLAVVGVERALHWLVVVV